jgi:RNA polymerase sigma factor (sigma-70 family)
VEKYFAEVSKYPLLSPDDEKRLARRARRGDREARELLIQSNLRLVISIARDNKRRSASLAELITEGNYGLMEAIENYDVERGLKFSTYATYRILRRVKQCAEPSSRKVQSLDEALHIPQPEPEIIPDTGPGDAVWESVASAFETCLLDSERQVLTFRYLSEAASPTLKLIGEKLHLSKEEVRTLELEGLRKLAEAISDVRTRIEGGDVE